MIKTAIGIIILQFVFIHANAQKSNQLIDFSTSVGKKLGSGSLSYIYNWQLGKNKKIQVGAGARFSSFFSRNKYFITAPAKLTSGSTGPTVIFKENINSNLDSLFLASSNVNSLNLTINIGYQITKKITAGFNIDALGITFGKNQKGKYINSNTVVNTSAKPTGFNLLLISDNDLGSLNSEFYAAYKLNSKWLAKAGYQFLFAEYTTATSVQQYPSPNDRFRYKSSALLLGVRYQLK